MGKNIRKFLLSTKYGLIIKVLKIFEPEAMCEGKTRTKTQVDTNIVFVLSSLGWVLYWIRRVVV